MADERNSGAPVAAKAGAAAPVLTLDRSRPFSEVIGDTDHNVGFVQDTLQFDKGGRLIRKLLSPEQKALVERKIARMQAAIEEAESTPVEDTSNNEPDVKVIDDDPDSDVNLVLWYEGKVKYLPHVLYRVAKKRFAKRFNSLDEIKSHMVKEGIVR